MKINVKKKYTDDFRPYPFIDFAPRPSFWNRHKHRLPLFIFGVMCFLIGFFTRGVI